MSKTTTTTTTTIMNNRVASLNNRVASRPSAGSKFTCACGLDRGHSAPCITTPTPAPAPAPKTRKSRKEQATIRAHQVLKIVERLRKLFVNADDQSVALVEFAIANLRDLGLRVAALPDEWKTSAHAPKAVHVGDIVNLKDNGKIKAIYADAIMASELDGMTVENVGTRMVRCTTAVSKATVIIPARHLVKAASKTEITSE